MDGGRIDGLDAAKGVAIVGVIALHVLATGAGVITDRWLEWVLVVVTGLCKLSVPVFVAVTAYLTCRRAPRPGAVRARLAGMLFVYIAWSALYVLLAHAVGGAALSRLDATSPAEVVLLGGAWYHLYYLAVVPQLLVVMPLVRRVVASADVVTVVLVGAIALLALGSVTDGSGVLGQVFHRHWILVWIPAAVAGGAVAAGTLRVNGRVWLFVGAGVVVIEAVVAQHTGAPVMTTYARAGVPVAAAGAVAAALAWRAAPWLSSLGRRSLGIYVLHPALLAVLGSAHHDRPYPLWALPLVLVAVTATAWVATIALERTPLRRLVELGSRHPVVGTATLSA